MNSNDRFNGNNRNLFFNAINRHLSIVKEVSRAKNLIAFLVLVMFALTIGCASSPKPVVINEYKMSPVHEDFPVPEQALEREVTFRNPNIAEGAKYELENIGGEQGLYPPKAFLEGIRASGWTEIEEERLGHVHFFVRMIRRSPWKFERIRLTCMS